MCCTPLPTARILQLWDVGGLKPQSHCSLLLKMSFFQGLSLLEATQRAAQHKGMMELAGMTGKLLEGFTLQGQCWGQLGWGKVTKKAGRDGAVCHG